MVDWRQEEDGVWVGYSHTSDAKYHEVIIACVFGRYRVSWGSEEFETLEDAMLAYEQNGETK